MKAILLLFIIALASAEWDGIDISEWQGPDIDFNAVRSQKSFVIIRGGAGTSYHDKYYEQNYQRAKAAGLDVGFYLYAHATNAEEARAEAEATLNYIRGKQFEYPIMYDIEDNNIFQHGAADIILQEFCSILEANHYYCGVYSSLSFLYSYFSPDVRNKYDAWVAQWAGQCTYEGPHGMWQYTSTGSVPGIPGNVDMDKAYYNYPETMRNKHLNGF